MKGLLCFPFLSLPLKKQLMSPPHCESRRACLNLPSNWSANIYRSMLILSMRLRYSNLTGMVSNESERLRNHPPSTDFQCLQTVDQTSDFSQSTRRQVEDFQNDLRHHAKRNPRSRLDVIGTQPEAAGEVKRLIADPGFFSEKNVIACEQAQIEPFIAVARDEQHPDWRERDGVLVWQTHSSADQFCQ